MQNHEYSTGIVVFLDILGFKDKVQKSEISEILTILKYINAYNTSDGVNDIFNMKDLIAIGGVLNSDIEEIKNEVRVSQFSDSIVITLKCSATNKKIRLQAIVNSVAYLTYKLAASNFFIRGGICIGRFYHNKNIFVGPAIIEAVDLEKKANYPRVVLSDKLHIAVNSYKYLKRDSEFCYVDWLKYRLKTKCQFEQDDLSIIKEHIESSLSVYSENSTFNQRIIEKYKWLKNEINEAENSSVVDR